jgi:hypothetical protein
VSTEKISRPGPGRQATSFSRGHDYLRKVDPVIGRLIEQRPDFDPLAWLDELPPMGPVRVSPLSGDRTTALRRCDKADSRPRHVPFRWPHAIVRPAVGR